MFRGKINGQVNLTDVFIFERENWHDHAMSLSQRFEFCLGAFTEMERLLAQEHIPDCIGLVGIIINISDKDVLNVTLGATKIPTTTDLDVLYSLLKLTISSTADPKKTPSDKIAVQLLGQLFLNIFRIIWDANEGEQLQQKIKLLSEGKLPFKECFQIGFREKDHDKRRWREDIRHSYHYLDSDSANKLSTLLAKMNCNNPDVCPTFKNAFSEFLSITTAAKLIQLNGNEINAILSPTTINSIISKNNPILASAASAAASVSASLSASCTLFSSMNVSSDDLIASQAIPDNRHQQRPKY